MLKILRLKISVLIALVIFTISGAGSAQVVRVGWYDSPFNYEDKFGRRAGYGYDYQQKIAAYTGWTYEFVYGTWPELFQMLRAGQIDILSDVSYTKERAAEMLFTSLPMGAETYYLYIAASNNEISAHDLSSLNGKKVGVDANSYQAGLFREWAAINGITAQLIEFTEHEKKVLKMLERGEIDAYVTLDIYEDDENHLLVPITKIGQSDFFFAVNKNRHDLLNELNFALGKINDENHFFNNQLYEKYLRSSGTNALISNDEVNWLSQHGAIKVGYLDNYLPFCASSMGDVTGMLKDYLALAANCTKNATLNFETKSYPTLQDAFNALKAGEIDCVFPVHLSYFDAENLGVMVTTPFVETEIYTLVKKNSDKKISFDRKTRIAVNETNFNYKTFIRDNFPNGEILSCNSVEDCLDKVENSLADCAIISNYQAAPQILNHSDLYALATGASMNFAFAVNKSDSELYYILNKTASLVPAASIHSALTDYSNSGYKFSITDFLRSNIYIVLALLAAVAFAALKYTQNKAQQQSKELHERIKVQNQMLENERKAHEIDSIISAVAADYRSVYYVDLERNEGTCYRAKTNSSNRMSDLQGVKKGDKFPFREKLTEYANEYVAESDRADFLKFIEPENIREKLSGETITGHRYLTIRDGIENYEMIKIVNINSAPNGSKLKAVSIGFANVDSETREILQQNRFMSEELKKKSAK